MPDWMLDELDHAGPEHLDAAYVAGYEAKAGFDPREDVRALRDGGSTDSWTVIDAGAGTGVFARAMARYCARVIAFDPSPAMTSAMRVGVAGDSLTNVVVVDAGFLTYDHEGEPADAVFSRNALHHLPDFWKAIALSRIWSALKPGGLLRVHDLVFDFEPSDASRTLEPWFEGAVTDPSAGYTRGDLATHVRTEFSTYRWLFEEMLDHAGFDVVNVAYRRSVYATYACVRRVDA